MKRTSKARWNGDLKNGSGELTTQSQVLNKTQYSFNTRFAEGIGTNPEELLAAAHAGCFTMALAHLLSQLNFTAGDLETTAVVSFDLAKGGITDIALSLDATAISGLSQEAFVNHANDAKQNCFISKALGGTQINLSVNYKS
jgi:osmotically inducible protein OsmC